MTMLRWYSWSGSDTWPGAALPEASTRARPALGFDAERLKRIDAAIDRAIEQKEVPGAVV